MLEIGVRVPRRFEDGGEYLADARALDAAGVDSLWLDESGYDSWLLLAAIATVTGRVRLVAPVARGDDLTPERLRACVDMLRRLSRDRLVLGMAGIDGPSDPVLELARRSHCRVVCHGVADVQTGLAARAADGVVVIDEAPDSVRKVAEDIALRRTDGDRHARRFELWATVKIPDDRDSWRRTRRDYETAGATGIILPADPRLLDLLRNGDEDDDRSDLGLAQG
jgi:alkanesulfonate monooxygenase SsuD/methylene tetrahydromethanopterin reductase-like flavin-dependent oxidoreductase (luciferase family)